MLDEWDVHLYATIPSCQSIVDLGESCQALLSTTTIEWSYLQNHFAIFIHATSIQVNVDLLEV